jgi:thiol-disulfide isomerase/thioredoxin
MSRQKYRKKRQRQNNTSALIGGGLLVLGIALALLLFRNNNFSGQASPSEPSVIPVSVNFAAPQLALESLDGDTQSLEEYRGKVVLVNNWATWCPPCKAEMPSLKKFHDAHADEGFTVVAVEAGDGKDQVLAFAQKLGLTFPVWLDPDNASLKAINNGNLPNSYVIDRTGNVRLAWTGEISLAALEKYVTPIIQESN